MAGETPSNLTRLSGIQTKHTPETIDQQADQMLKQITDNLRAEIDQIAANLTSSEKLTLAAEIIEATASLKRLFQNATKDVIVLSDSLNQQDPHAVPPISEMKPATPQTAPEAEPTTRVIQIPSPANEKPQQTTDKESLQNKLCAMKAEVFDIFDKKTAGVLYIHGFQHLGDIVIRDAKLEKVKSILSDQTETITAKLEELNLNPAYEADESLKAEYKKWKAEEDRKSHYSPK